MTSPRVAVIVPCFNHGEFLPDALRSVRQQTLRDIDVLIVDDGSHERGTLEVLDRLRSGGVRVVRTENRGLPAARNTGVRETDAPYVCCLDADDLLAPAWLEKAVAVLDTRPDVAFVSHWLRTFGAETWEWRPSRCDFPALLSHNTVNGAAVVRRAAFEAVGGFDESFRQGCEDWDLWITLVERGYAGHIIHEVLFHYRRREGSMSRLMVDSGAHVDVLERVVRKHEATYRAHILDVIVDHDHEHETARLHDEIAALEHEHASVLEPQRRAAEAQLARLTARSDALTSQLDRESRVGDLSARVASLEAEVLGLRSSWSWRLTAPLRSVVDRLRGAGGR
jgi:glycosyltransferase involved in cell wall biosynthesis